MFGLLQKIAPVGRDGFLGAEVLDAFVAVAAKASWVAIGLSGALLAAAFAGLAVIALKEPEAVSRPKRESFVRIVKVFRLTASFVAVFPVIGIVAVIWRLVKPALGLGEVPEGVAPGVEAQTTQGAIEGMVASAVEGTVGILLLVGSVLIRDSLVKAEESDRRILETERNRLSQQICQTTLQLAKFESRRGTKPETEGRFVLSLVARVTLLHLLATIVVVGLAALLSFVLTLAEGSMDPLAERTETYIRIALRAFAVFSVCWILPACVIRSANWYGPPTSAKSGETGRGKRIRWPFVGSIAISIPLVAIAFMLWGSWISGAGDGWWITLILTLTAAFCVFALMWDTPYSTAAFVREVALTSHRASLEADSARLRQLDADHEAHEAERLSALKTELSQRVGFLFPG